jgi:hypothetical protein
MALATWWASDRLMDLTPLSNFHVRLATDDEQLATINHISVAEVAQRRRDGHLPYVGYMDETAVTYGWVATRQASIGELNLVFPIAADSRYLSGVARQRAISTSIASDCAGGTGGTFLDYPRPGEFAIGRRDAKGRLSSSGAAFVPA